MEIWSGTPKMRFLPFKLPYDKSTLIEGALKVRRIICSIMKRSLCTIDMAEDRH